MSAFYNFPTGRKTPCASQICSQADSSRVFSFFLFGAGLSPESIHSPVATASGCCFKSRTLRRENGSVQPLRAHSVCARGASVRRRRHLTMRELPHASPHSFTAAANGCLSGCRLRPINYPGSRGKLQSSWRLRHDCSNSRICRFM